MIIAVDTRVLVNGHIDGNAVFINETFNRLAAQHPEHEFIFIFDRPFGELFVKGKNVKGIVVGPTAKNPLLWKYWYGIKIPTVLKKYKADVFVTGDAICSLKTKLPQCLIINDLSFLHHPSFIKRSHLRFYKKYTPKFLEKAAAVATLSEFLKNDIVDHYKTAVDKIDVVYSGVKEIFQPLSHEEKLVVKNMYSGEREYFIYSGIIHPRKNLVGLLKAFSVFKKRQKTNMKLLLVGRLDESYRSFAENLKSYKFRDDVVMLGDVEESERAKITAAAYGMIFPSFYEGFSISILEAMKCDVPVITSANSSMQEIAKDAALYVDANDITAIAEKMMLMYKDENLRKELILKGRVIANEYSWDRTAELLWESIRKSVNKNPV